MITFNNVYSAGISIGSGICHITGINDTREAINHCRSGNIKKAKLSGYKAGVRLLGAAALITGIYFATAKQFTNNSIIEESQNPIAKEPFKIATKGSAFPWVDDGFKQCFKEAGLENYDYLEETGVLNYVCQQLADTDNLQEIINKSSAYLCKMLEKPDCNPIPFVMDLSRALKSCMLF